ncbi:hypothetical protein LTR56_001739 [Elasticomyces elasticus]|nr:hypothetical protein LTR56_001739 [Elasticomyces elasticus]KAK3668910.1 hypothetical protein LTR22_000390 [Elasticomyces elasticus]KAK4925026.1 hypothetical protein LTR49_008032 [Elasticomyces elasticus]KAK5763283.1 hypothetical protein LTS12_006667 [Elasticomyces elasticus]
MEVRGIVGYQVEYLGVTEHESPDYNDEPPIPKPTEEERRKFEEDIAARAKEDEARRELALTTLDVLQTNRLPPELVIRTLAARATNALPEFTLQDETTLPTTASRLLETDAPAELLETLRTAILESVPINIASLAFIRQGAGTIAQFPQFSIPLLHSIRTLFFPIDIAPQSQYPARLFRITAGMASLQQQLPNLHLLIVLVRFRYSSYTPLMGDRLKGMCTPIGAGQITLREALERLVTAMQANRVGRRQVLQLGWEIIDHTAVLTRTQMPTFTAVDIDQRGAGELVELATTTSNANGTPNALG